MFLRPEAKNTPCHRDPYRLVRHGCAWRNVDDLVQQSGIFTLTAKYGGDANFTGSTSAPFTLTCSKQPMQCRTFAKPNPQKWVLTRCDSGSHLEMGWASP